MKKYSFKKVSGTVMTGILCIVLLLAAVCLVPVNVKGAPSETYELWVAGVQVTKDNEKNVLAGDAANNGKISYNPDTGTLTLNGVDISYRVDTATAANAKEYGAVYSKDMDLTIALLGENKITVITETSGTEGGTSDQKYQVVTGAVYCENGNLSMTGPGSLEASNQSTASVQSSSSIEQIVLLPAIYSDKKLTVTGCRVTANAAGTICGRGFETSAAVYAVEEILISGGELTAECGVKAEEGDAAAVYTGKGMEAVNQSVINILSSEAGVYCAAESGGFGSEFSFLNIDNSVLTVQAKSPEEDFSGIIVEGRTSVKNGAKVLVEGSAPGMFYGVSSYWLDIDNGALTVNGDNAEFILGVDGGPEKKTETTGYEQYGFGIKVTNNGTLTVNAGVAEGTTGIFAMDIEADNNGSIIVKSSKAANDSAQTSVGIQSFTDIRLKNGGAITAQAGAAEDMSVGIMLFGTGNLEQSGGTLTAQAGVSDLALAIYFMDEDGNPRNAGYVINRDEWDFVIKAGREEASAGVIDAVTDDAVKNSYISIQYVCRHVWSKEWASDGTHHWHNCMKENCTTKKNEEKDGYAAHTPGKDDNDCTTAVLCTVCNAVTTPAAAKHEFLGAFLHDADGHWQICAHDGCLSQSVKADHTYVEGTPNPAPTYETEGKRIDTCVCGQTKTVVLPKLEPIKPQPEKPEQTEPTKPEPTEPVQPGPQPEKPDVSADGEEEDDGGQDGQNAQAAKSPATGDVSNPAGWLAVLLFSGTLLTVYGCSRFIPTGHAKSRNRG